MNLWRERERRFRNEPLENIEMTLRSEREREKMKNYPFGEKGKNDNDPLGERTERERKKQK